MTQKEANRDLQKLLQEKEAEISRISKELLMQKEEILSQKELIETQRDVAVRQRDEIVFQKKEITSSITYAKRIQAALIPGEEVFRKNFKDYFILHRPKDIVSGDFFWIGDKEGMIIVAAADSTGHGVPGAFMSLMGIVFLNEIVDVNGILQPSLILNSVREKIIKSLGHEGRKDDLSDAIEMAVISFDRERSLLQYAGALHPVYLVRRGELTELRPDRMPLGFSYIQRENSFTNQELPIKPGDRIYMTTDGYADQFGWRNNKKFLTRNFKELLMEIQHLPMKAQRLVLDNTLENWKGEMEQVDDILVMGLEF
jgi:serine phosphatase RsbU (regulator of sigma subunit)